MNVFCKYSLVFVFLLPLSLSAQDIAEVDNSRTKKESKIFSYEKSVSNFLQINQARQSASNSNMSNFRDNRNLTIIQQVGQQNRALTNTISANSDIQYLQRGDNNLIESVNFIDNVTERVLQNGDNNRVNNFSFGNVDASSLNIIQNGNNLSFDKFGTNSQTNNLTLRVTGNNQGVIIRSF